MEKKHKFNLWYFLITFWLLIALHGIWEYQKTVEAIPYSQFQSDLEQGRIKQLTINEDMINGVYKTPVNGKTGFLTPRMNMALANQLDKYHVEYTAEPRHSILSTLVSWVVPVLIFFLIWYFAFRNLTEKQGMGRYLTIGKSGAKIYMEQDTKVSMSDVAGVDEAKEEVREIIDFLKNPQAYTKLGAHSPKGVLLVGPPGTGKTLLAKAIAGEAKVPFFSISGSQFVELFVGVGAARVRDLFQEAKEKAPAIIFIDELDALGRARGAYPLTGGHDEREQTLNQLLAEMDGFDPSTSVILIAATNRPEILDPALLRAGRFDRQVLVDRPDKIGRLQILYVHVKKIQLGQVDLEQVASMTTGFSGADLATLVNEAAILATRQKRDSVGLSDFTQAIERVIAGLEKKSRILNPEERKRIAYHEMGHALVALATPGTDPVHKISIIPRGIAALGYTIQRPTEDRYLMTRSELKNKLKVLMGGRAAEILIFGEVSTGTCDDLGKASGLGRNMITIYGMEESLGCVAYEELKPTLLGRPNGESFQEVKKYSELTAERIDESLRHILDEAYNQARELLHANRKTLEKWAMLLLEKETLEADVLKELIMDLNATQTFKHSGLAH